MTQIKLYSPKGTMLGLLTMPDGVIERLLREGCVRVPIMQPPRIPWAAEVVSPQVSVDTFTIIRSHWARDAFELHGMPLEEIEKLLNYAFSPSATYLRSMVAD